jgi:hypothetical protein
LYVNIKELRNIIRHFVFEVRGTLGDVHMQAVDRNPLMLFHGTSSKLLNSIKKHGLLPQTDVLRHALTPYMGDSMNPDFVSLTNSRTVATRFANFTVDNVGGVPIVITLNSSNLKLFTDPEEVPHRNMFLSKGRISTNTIVSIREAS